MNVKDIVQQLSDTGEKMYCIPATVSAVNGKLCDVDPINGDATIFDVQLQANDESNGILISPKVGSIIMVAMTSKNTGIAVMFGEIDSIYLHGNQYGGLVRIQDLVTKINNLENKVNSIITTYDTHTHPVSGALAAITTNLITGILTPTIQSEIENLNVQHG